MTFAEYLQSVAKNYLETKKVVRNYRMGQAYINSLPEPQYTQFMEMTYEDAKEIDPFHKDENLPQFLAYIETQFER